MGRGELAEELKERLVKKGKFWFICQLYMTEAQLNEAYQKAVSSMSTLNMYAASLMKKYKAHGATDVTGFGLLGHAQNLVEAQPDKVDFVIENLPVIRGTEIIEKKVVEYGLFEGTAVETSGGLLMALPAEDAENFRSEFKAKFGMEDSNGPISLQR